MNVFSFLKHPRFEILFTSLLFIFLWTYLIIRANTVFYNHDELITKWMYMVSWNPTPYSGFIDANNHFLNSFFGSLFIRLFNSDSIFIVRLGNIMFFPLFFWSIYSLCRFFETKINFYLLLISLSCTAFVIEFFGMARGYGISIALMTFAISQTIIFLDNSSFKRFTLILIAWILATYTNLTLIPFALFGIIFLVWFIWKQQPKKWLLATIPFLVLIMYFVKYAFFLKDNGNLYMGNQNGFINTTLHSIIPFVFNTTNTWVDVILIFISALILLTLVYQLVKSKNLFKPKLVFSLFLVTAILNILLQNWLLGINFPEDRAAVYLVVFFFGGFSFTLDILKSKWNTFPFIVIFLLFFGLHFNINRFITFQSEHFDIELLTRIPSQVNGIPPSTGGRREWTMDNELSRIHNITPLPLVQLAKSGSDTLQDYIIYEDSLFSKSESRQNFQTLYHPIYKDKISDLVLFERNTFLPREKIKEKLTTIDGDNEYFNLYYDDLNQPIFLRCYGYLENIDIFKRAIIVFAVENSLTSEKIYYQKVPLVQSCTIKKDKTLKFDFTFSMNAYAEADIVKVSFWNINRVKQKGECKLEVYNIY